MSEGGAPGAASFEDGRKRAPPFILLNKETNDGSPLKPRGRCWPCASTRKGPCRQTSSGGLSRQTTDWERHEPSTLAIHCS